MERDPDRAFERRPTPLAPCSAWIAAARGRSSRSPARFRRAVDRLENLKLAGTGRFRSNNRDRRFESIPFRQRVSDTNAIESLNAQVRKAVRVRGHFPSEEAATKLIWLVLRNVQARWKNPPISWHAAKTQLAIQFEQRFMLTD